METTLQTWEIFLNIKIFFHLYFFFGLRNIFELIYFSQQQVGTCTMTYLLDFFLV